MSGTQPQQTPSSSSASSVNRQSGGLPEIDLVLSGGASNCVQLTAAAFELAKHCHVARVGGTSAGSLGSIAFAFDVPEKVVLDLFFENLQGDRLLDKNVLNFYEHMGLCRGNALRKGIADLIGDQTTMGQAKRPFFCMVSDLYTSQPMCISSWKNPSALVADVGVASSSVPGLFCMQEIRGLGLGNRKFVDGGVAKNFAMDVFDDVPERPTIGVRVKQPVDVNPVRQGDALAWAKSVARLFLWSSDNAHLSTKNHARVIEVQAADGFNFSLDRAEVLRRWELGKAAALAVVAKL